MKRLRLAVLLTVLSVVALVGVGKRLTYLDGVETELRQERTH